MLLSFVPVLLYTAVTAGIKCKEFFPGTFIRTRARVPSPSPPRASIGPEPEPSIRRWTITLSLPELPREPEHPSVTRGCRAFTGTAEVNQVHTFCEFESPRLHIRINSWVLFLVHKLTCGKRESASLQHSMKLDEQWEFRILFGTKTEGTYRGGEGTTPETTACPEAGK